MKKSLLIGTSLLITGLLVFICISEGFAQTKQPEILMSFQRQKNGRVAFINAVNQKQFEFLVQGLTTQVDVDNFTAKFAKKDLFISIKISEVSVNGQRKGTIVMAQNAKLPNFKALLKDAGITTISIDGELKSVDELGKNKK